MTIPYTKIAVVIVIVVCSLSVGIIIGYYSHQQVDKNHELAQYYSKLVRDYDSEGLQSVIRTVNPENIRENLKYMTSYPHQGGTLQDKTSADFIFQKLKAYGVDDVSYADYDVYLDFSDDVKYNSIEIKNATSTDGVQEIKELDYDNNPNSSFISKPYLAYAKNGIVTSNNVYYVNYCTESDFEHLISTGLNVTNSIVLCRYGKIYRGKKVSNAAMYGAIGSLIYEDPLRVAPPQSVSYIYPNGEFMPKEGLQRGSIIAVDGDILTPHYPSTDYMYRNQDNLQLLPSIPAQVIGYGLACQILNSLESQTETISSWKGQMSECLYKYGGQLKNNKSLTLSVYNKPKVAKTFNVVGVIRGTTESDHYVIIGNHRDSWAFGSIDPTSGTAVLLELARVLVELRKSGAWTPKRTVLLMNWGSEEYSLTGSIEWVEEYKKKLLANSIIYINLDSILMGNYSFGAKSSPLVYDFLVNVAKTIPLTSSETVYDRWRKNEPNSDGSNVRLVSISSGSDFAQKIGIPCIDQYYTRDYKNKLFENVGWYPLYHSSYETYNLITKIIDKNFEAFKISTIFVVESVRILSESLILPFSVIRYAKELSKEYTEFEKQYGVTLNDLGISLDKLKDSIRNFSITADKFHGRLDEIDRSKYHEVRLFNDQLRNVENAFLDGSGRERKGYEHVVHAPSIADPEGGIVFPAVTDAIYTYKRPNGQTKDNLAKININMSLSIVVFALQSGISILKEPFDFTRA